MGKRLLLLATVLFFGIGCLFSAYGQVNVVTKAGSGGSITESEGVCTVTPDQDYRIHTVFINDSVCRSIAPLGAETVFTLTDPGDYTVTATFLPVSEVDVWDGTMEGMPTQLQGSGTAADPYQINSCKDWIFLSEQPELFMGRNEFILTKHLDFNNQATPIVGHKGKWNNVSDVNEPFIGFFNGNNKTFININILNETANNVPTGLFGSISGNASERYNSVICNLGIVSGIVNSSNNVMGGIVGSIEGVSAADFLGSKTYAFAGSIFNCYNHATINKKREETGGIFGRRNGTSSYLHQDVMLANCYNRGKASNGIGGKSDNSNTEYPCYSIYNSGDIYEGNYYYKLVREGTVLNSYYDTSYAGGKFTSISFGMSTKDMCTQRMVDLLNAAPNAPYYNQKAWVIDPEGIINAGKPYLNNAYRVYSATGEKIFIPAAGYHPNLAYEGDSYRFMALVSGTIQVNGETVTPDAEGYYTVENVSGKLEISCDDAQPANISVWDGQSMEEIKVGDGSPENPYQISNAAQFIWVAMNMKDTESSPKTSDSFILTTDIDFNGFYHPFLISQGSVGFSGTFDGQGHKFFNLRIKNKYYHVSTGNDSNLGIFGKIVGVNGQPDCVVKNISIESGSIYGNRNLGGIAGYCSSAGSTKVILENNVVKNILIRTASASSTDYGPYTGLIVGQVQHSNCTLKNNYGFGKYLWSFSDGTDEPEGIMPKSHLSGALIGFITNSKPLLNNNYVVFYGAPDQLFHGDKNGGVSENSANNYYLGTDPTYGKTEAELQSQAMVDLLNNGQRKVWTRDDNLNNGFPIFNKTYAVSLPTIENGRFEPVELCETDVAYEGDSYLFRLVPVDSMKPGEEFKVLVNGDEVTANQDSIYVVENVQEAFTVTYEGTLVIKTFVPELIFNDTEGSITSSPAEVTYGEDVTFTITPVTGYEVNTVTVNVYVVDILENTLTVTDVTDYLTIEVTFKKQTFDIIPLAGIGGTIELAEGSVNPVTYGESATFNFVPEEGYLVKQVKVDDEEKGSLVSYTFENVKETHTLEVVFEKQTFEITVSSNEGGEIELADGSVNPVTYGESVTFNFVPEEGYLIKQVKVDGEDKGILKYYTFENVKATHTLEVVFEEDQSGLSGVNEDTVSVLYRNGTLTLDGRGTIIDKVAVFSLSGALLHEQVVGGEMITISIDIPTPTIVVIVEIDGQRKVFKKVNDR